MKVAHFSQIAHQFQKHYVSLIVSKEKPDEDSNNGGKRDNLRDPAVNVGEMVSNLFRGLLRGQRI